MNRVERIFTKVINRYQVNVQVGRIRSGTVLTSISSDVHSKSSQSDSGREKSSAKLRRPCREGRASNKFLTLLLVVVVVLANKTTS